MSVPCERQRCGGESRERDGEDRDEGEEVARHEQLGDKPREHAARQVHGHLLEVLCCKVDDFDLMSTPDYALCTRRALEAAQYFKRFAESVLGVDRENVEQVS